MSILDTNAEHELDELVAAKIEIAKLKEVNDRLDTYHKRMKAELHDRLPYFDRHMLWNEFANRIEKMDEMYEMVYGDTPLCDSCDGETGFFLEVDMLYRAFKKYKWLLKILRWGNYYKRKDEKNVKVSLPNSRASFII